MKTTTNKKTKIAQYSVLALAASAVLPVACNKDDDDKVTDDPLITYVKIDSVLTQTDLDAQVEYIDLNNDGIDDFRMYTDVDSNSSKVKVYSGVYADNTTRAAILSKKITGDFFLDGSTSDKYFNLAKNSGDVVNASQSIWFNGKVSSEVGGFTQIFTKAGVTVSDQAGDFAGKGDKFIGVRFKDGASANHYGWLKVNLSANGRVLRVVDGAYHVTPDAEIKVGAK